MTKDEATTNIAIKQGIFREEAAYLFEERVAIKMDSRAGSRMNEGEAMRQAYKEIMI